MYYLRADIILTPNMVKNKKTLKKNTEKYNKATVLFGYLLFAATVITFITGTLYPFASGLFQFSGPNTRYTFIITSILAFAAAIILPALASYLLGDHATHTKNRTLHHYNGVLFGFAAYWISMVFSSISYQSIFGFQDFSTVLSIVITNVVPVILTLAVMAILAVQYAKSDTKASTLYFRPFQVIVLIATLAHITFLLSVQHAAPESMIAVSIISLLVPTIPVVIAYTVFAKVYTTRFARLTAALISMYILWISGAVIASLFSSMQMDYSILAIGSQIGGVALWVLYLVLSARLMK